MIIPFILTLLSLFFGTVNKDKEKVVNFKAKIEGTDYVPLIEQGKYSEIPADSLETFLKNLKGSLIEFDRLRIDNPQAREVITTKIRDIRAELERRQ